jgi:hypothetical protein
MAFCVVGPIVYLLAYAWEYDSHIGLGVTLLLLCMFCGNESRPDFK